MKSFSSIGMEEATGLIEAYDRLIANDLAPDTLDIVLGYLKKKTHSNPLKNELRLKLINLYADTLALSGIRAKEPEKKEKPDPGHPFKMDLQTARTQLIRVLQAAGAEKLISTLNAIKPVLPGTSLKAALQFRQRQARVRL